MDAFAQFSILWRDKDNPFSYLLELKDEHGRPRYQPYPAPPLYPLLSVHRLGWRPRASQSWGVRVHRNVGWLTISDNAKKQDLANVAQVRMPSAWDFRFQIDHFCMNPSTQSNFITSLMQAFSYFGGQPQTWIDAVYPGHWGHQTLHMVMDGDIQSVTPEVAPEGEVTQFRTSFSVTVEGYCPEINYAVVPSLWTLVAESKAVAPDALTKIFSTDDLRPDDGNDDLNSRPNIPPKL